MLISLIDKLERLDVILASASPRRFEILQNIGLEFKVVTSDYKEHDPPNYLPQDLAELHALSKGRLVAEQYPEALVISADTIVICGERVLGKPKDEDDALDMLQLLAGRTHQVVTAFALHLFKYERSVVKHVSTDVTFRELRREEILAYINTGEPFDKAGAYAIQGQGGMLIDKIDGCYFNVMGFPVSKFYETLEEFMTHFEI